MITELSITFEFVMQVLKNPYQNAINELITDKNNCWNRRYRDEVCYELTFFLFRFLL